MKSSGFSLIEVIISMAIGALISIMVYQVFTQTTRVTNRVGTLVDDYADTFIMSSQLERDIMGIVLIPLDTKETATQSPSPGEPGASSVAAASGEEAEQSREEKLSFSGKVRDGKLETLSFITTNALPQIDIAASRLVRVRYFVQPQRGEPALMQLMREEMPFHPTKQISASERRAYPLLSRVESITLTFYIAVKKGEEQSMTTLTEWGSEEQQSKIGVAAPEFIAITGSYRSHLADESIPFSLMIAIPVARLAVYDYEKEQEKKAKGAEAQKKQEGKCYG